MLTSIFHILNLICVFFFQNFQNILLTMIMAMPFVSFHVYIFISYTYLMIPSSNLGIWFFSVTFWCVYVTMPSWWVSLSWMGAMLQNFINGSPLLKTFFLQRIFVLSKFCRYSSMGMYLITFSFSYFNAEMYDFMIQIWLWG